jgi:tRNA/tmRNA/rRNA uracil-C5-methylase (TrmA/RlmC/RlmD family)
MDFKTKVRETLKIINSQSNPEIKIICPKQNLNYRNKTIYSFNSKQDKITFQFISKEHIEIIRNIKQQIVNHQIIKDLFIKSNNLNKIQLCFTLFENKLKLLNQTPEEYIKNILGNLNNSDIVSIYYRLYSDESKSKIDTKEIKQYPYFLNKLEETVLGIKIYLSPYTFSRINTDISPKIYKEVLNNSIETNNIILYGRDIYFLYKYLNLNNLNVLGITHCKITYKDIIEDESLLKSKSKIIYSEKKDYTKNLELNQLPKSIVILTAGRKGLSQDLNEYFLRQKEIIEIVYIACNRDSMKKDLGILNKNFSLEKVVIIDEFPNTNYNNTILNLKRKPKFSN